MSKGEKSIQNKQGIWCPRRAAGFVKVGQCSRRNGPGKGRQLRPSLGPRHSKGLDGPASWPDGRVMGAVSSGPWVRQLASSSLNAPFLDPRGHQRACTGEDTGLSRRDSSIYSGSDEAPFTSGVPHHTPPALAVSTPLLSHTHTPVGSLVKGGD